ncbi:MAG TPA: hypothetical protein DD456_12260 [Stenotrophomonas sp.]|nr:hypothetical protein [Stenotrophomonas sp.]
MFSVGNIGGGAAGVSPSGGVVSLPSSLEYLARDSGLNSTIFATYLANGQSSSSGSTIVWLSRPAGFSWITDAQFNVNFQIRATVLSSNAVDQFTNTGAWLPLTTATTQIGLSRTRQTGVETWAYLRIEIRRISTGVIEATSDIYLNIKTV